MVCAALLSACWMHPRAIGIGFEDLCDEIDDPLVAEAFLFAPLI